MTHWNYRIVQKTHNESTYFGIYEVYYDDDTIVSYSLEPIDPYGDTIEDLRGDIDLMLKAFNTPVLIWEELEKTHAQSNSERSSI